MQVKLSVGKGVREPHGCKGNPIEGLQYMSSKVLYGLAQERMPPSKLKQGLIQPNLAPTGTIWCIWDFLYSTEPT